MIDPLPGIVESYRYCASLWPLVLVAILGGALAVATVVLWRKSR